MLPVSEIIKKKSRPDQVNNDDPPLKRSRQEDYKKAKELEEARKAGDVPAAVDEEGKDINPHIPQYISSVPFFYNTDQPTLKHQRVLGKEPKHVPLDLGIQRGLKVKNADKYRKGACENCGAMTHKKKDCLERPRKVGAAITNKDIAADEIILPKVEHTYDSKRDRWADCDPNLYKRTIEEYEKIEEAKRKLKDIARQAASQQSCEPGTSSDNKSSAVKDDLDSDSDDDEDKYADNVDMPGTKVDSKQRITVRNLRIREDTAKYLYNLDLESAYYDPKTRAMREDPLPVTKEDAQIGGNYVRYTGDVKKVNQTQLFAWQAAEKGIDIHLQALPTKTALIQKEFEFKKVEVKEAFNKYIKERYGDQKTSTTLPEQYESFIEYTRTGKVVRRNK